MQLSNVELWNQTKAINTDSYGKGTVDYAERWANLMETKLPETTDETFGDMAKQTSHEADTDGITGFMYGMAVSILAQCWEHGDRLRRWSNLSLQVGNEGEKSNEQGGTLNPALLTISLD